LHRKACGEQREDFLLQHKNQVLSQAVKEVQMDFFDSLRSGVPVGAPLRMMQLTVVG